MANPQVEDGYCKIANKIMEALSHTRIPGEARQILDVIIRKTYGWNKKEDMISHSQFAEITGLSRGNVYRGLNKLKQMNLIVLVPSKARAGSCIYSINKDFDTWKRLPSKTQVPSKKKQLPSKVKAKLPSKTQVTKDKKDTIQKKEGPDSHESDFPTKLSERFIEILNRFPWDVIKNEDCRWFEERIENNLQYSGTLNLWEELEGWEIWLEKELRSKMGKKRNRFPKNFKLSIHNWLKKAIEFKKNKPPQPPGQQFPRDVKCKFCEKNYTLFYKSFPCSYCREQFYEKRVDGTWKERYPGSDSKEINALTAKVVNSIGGKPK